MVHSQNEIEAIINCKKCKSEIKIYHLEWDAIICPKCKTQINNPEDTKQIKFLKI